MTTEAQTIIASLSSVFETATTGFEKFYKDAEKKDKGYSSTAASSGYSSKAASSGNYSKAPSGAPAPSAPPYPIPETPHAQPRPTA